MDKKTGACLWKLTWIPIKWHIPVKRDYSPDNPKLKKYWKKRQNNTNYYPFGTEKRLWIRQGGRCSICKMPIDNKEITHVHHIIPKKEGGSNKIDNLCILHKMCHQQIHSKQGKDIKVTTNCLSRVKGNFHARFFGGKAYYRIEMVTDLPDQVTSTAGFQERARYYAYKAFIQQADKGGKYKNLKEVIFLAFCNFSIVPNKKSTKANTSP